MTTTPGILINYDYSFIFKFKIIFQPQNKTANKQREKLCDYKDNTPKKKVSNFSGKLAT